MPEPVSITCPHCGARLKLKDSSKLGKKIACPKCQTPFRAEAPLEDDFNLDVDVDEFAAMEKTRAEEMPVLSRSSSSSRSRSPARKGKSAASSSRLPLIAGGAVLLLVAASLAGWLLTRNKEQPAGAAGTDVAQNAAPGSAPAADAPSSQAPPGNAPPAKSPVGTSA